MKVGLGRPYQVPSGRWVVYVECADGKLRRFTCREASAVYEVYQNQTTVRKTPRRPIRARFDILARDNYTCRYCGRQAPSVVLHVDHVIPVVKGGTDDPDNLVTACYDCNEGKGPRHSGGVADVPRSPDLAMDEMRSAMAALDRVMGNG